MLDHLLSVDHVSRIVVILGQTTEPKQNLLNIVSADVIDGIEK